MFQLLSRRLPGASPRRMFSAQTLARDMYIHGEPKEDEDNYALFMHGILGNKRNWRTPSKLLAKSNSNMRVIAVDHRGHGGSHGMSGANTVDACAEDLQTVIDLETAGSGIHSRPTLLAGHSFGGKVALTYLQSRYDKGYDLPEDTWILDCLPGLFDNTLVNGKSSESVQKIFEILAELPENFAGPAMMSKILVDKGVSLPVAQWLTSNCRFVPGTENSDQPLYQLGFDLSTCTELFTNFCALDLWQFVERFDGTNRAGNNKDARIHFLRAGRNPLWVPDVLDRMNHLQMLDKGVNFHAMSHVGHWLHVEDVRGMISLMRGASGCLS